MLKQLTWLHHILLEIIFHRAGKVEENFPNELGCTNPASLV